MYNNNFEYLYYTTHKWLILYINKLLSKYKNQGGIIRFSSFYIQHNIFITLNSKFKKTGIRFFLF